MRLGIMQPYFAPGLGYFDLIALCDEWIVFDTAQYRKRSWMNRNRILHPTSGAQYITANTAKHHLGTPLEAVGLSKSSDWQSHLLGQLTHYKAHAPYYERTTALVRDALDKETDSLVRLDVAILESVCQILGLRFAPQMFSAMGLTLGPIAGPGDWALRISEAMGATHYINPPGGESIFDRRAFEEAGVQLQIRHFEEMIYQTPGYEFMPRLSIIDVLMWNSVEHIAAYLDLRGREFAKETSSAG